MKLTKKTIFISLIIVAILSFLIYSYFSKGLFYSLTHQDVGSVVVFLDDFGIFAYLIFVLLVILEVILAPIPPLALYLAGGVLFGTLFGGILTLLGNIIGALIDFKLARKYGRGFVVKNISSKVKKRFNRFVKKYGIYSIFLLRINPLTTSDLFSYLAGLTKMKTRHFLMGTTLGLIPLIFAQTYFGEIFIKEHKFLYWVVIIISLIYLILVLYFIINLFVKKVRDRRNNLHKKD